MSVLGEEAVAGMDRLDVADLGGRDHMGDLEIALDTLGRPDADRLVGQSQIEGIPVGFAVDGDRFDAEFAAGADDSQSYLASVGNQNPFVHDPIAAGENGTGTERPW